MHKKHGNKWNSLWKGHDEIVDKVLDPNKCETSVKKMRSFGPIKLMKMGSIDKSPKTTWTEHMKHPRRVRPPKKLASRETTRIAAESIAHIIKSSPEFCNIIKLYLSYNKSPSNKSTNNKIN